MRTVAKKSLVVVSNIPTPYRSSFFEILGQELARRDISLTALFAERTEPGRQWDYIPNAETFCLHIMRGISVNVRGYHLRFNPTVIKSIRKARPDWIVVAGSWCGPSMLVTLLEAKRSGTPVIFWNEGHAQAVLHPEGVIAGLRRKVLSQYSGFCVPNQRSEDFALRESNRTIPVIRLANTVNDEYFLERGSRRAARETLGLADIRTLAMVSALEPRKRVVESLQTYLRLDPEVQHRFQIVVAGDGSLRNEVEVLANTSPRITWLGHRKQEDVRLLYQAAEVYLQASSYDPNPLSMIEAAFSGCGLMAAESVGNVDELIPRGSPYRIEDRKGVFESNLSTAMAHFASAEVVELEQLARDAGDRAREGFSLGPVAARFVDDLLRTFPPAS